MQLQDLNLNLTREFKDSIKNIKDQFYHKTTLINNSMNGLCKIGFTRGPLKNSHIRAKELSNSTSCPTEFKVAMNIKVKNPHKKPTPKLQSVLDE
jgi:hypothetical protein